MKKVDWFKKARKFILSFPDDTPCPKEYVEKYNTLRTDNPPFTVPGGRAWVMWFLDEMEKIKD